MTLTDGRIGQLLDGKYRLVELLARGGMGVVYGARHEATGRAVAVKILREELVTSPHLVRVVAEARLAVEASHPNVVEVLDAGADDDGVPYLVLERLFGHTLERILTRPLALLETVQALVPVMNAVSALHRAGIVHRDIKPSNLFLSRDAHGRVTPKLLDFGIAKALEATGSTLSGTALGTPAYMAPEQALGSRTLGPPTDVWAMGITLARCLTTKLPFDDIPANLAGSLRSGLDEQDFPGVAAPVARVLARALRFEPRERYGNMSEFRQALLSALSAVDASLRWPDETSVSHAADETELFAYVAALDSEPTPAEDAAVRRGREIHVATRTLSGLHRQSKHRTWGWVAAATLGLSATAIVVVALGTASFRGPSDGARVVLAAPAEPAQAASRDARATGGGGAGPGLATLPVAVTTDGPQSDPVDGRATFPPMRRAVVGRAPPAPVSRRESERATEQAKAAPEASSQSTPAAPTTAEAHASKSERLPVVGANRSPIIE